MPVKLVITTLLILLAFSSVADNASDAVTNLQAYARFKAGDYAAARMIWQQLAERGNTTAMINLANLFQQGMGVSEDQRAAFEYINKAAELGDPRAQYELGLEYEKGVLVERNLQLAATWLKRSAQQDDPDGQYAYAILLATSFGKGLSRATASEKIEALHWFKKARDNGHPDAADYIRLLSR